MIDNTQIAQCIFDAAIEDALFPLLCQSVTSDEGNLLEHTSRELAIEKIEVIHAAIRSSISLGILLEIMEIGTNKAFFGLVLWNIYKFHSLLAVSLDARPKTIVRTFDTNPESEQAVCIMQRYLDIRFILGDSKETFAGFNRCTGSALAWIDGGHDYETALSDIRHALKLGIDTILVDDMDLLDVWKAVTDAIYEINKGGLKYKIASMTEHTCTIKAVNLIA